MENIEAHTMKLLGTVPAGTMKSSAVHFLPDDVLYGRLRPYLNKVYRPDFEGLCSAEFIVFPKTESISSRYLQYFLNSSSFASYASHLNAGDRPRVDFEQLSPYPFPVAPYEQQQRIVAEIEKQFSRLDEAVANLKRTKANLKRYKAAVLKAAVEGKLTEDWRMQHPDIEPASKLLERILIERRAKWKGKRKYKAPAEPDMSNLFPLPDEWIWASTDQLSAGQPYALAIGPFGSNLKVSDYTASGVPLIFVRNIRSETFGGNDAVFVSERKAEELKSHQISGGDILITKMGAPPGDACLYPEARSRAVITADCIKLRLSPLLSDKHFFVHAINSQVVKPQILGITKGVAQMKMSLARFSRIAIPLPPLTEQRQIVAEVERRLSVIEKLEAAVRTNLTRAERMRQSILSNVFAGKLVCANTNQSGERSADIQMAKSLE
jgi:type I restriction enzyme S subunit